MISEDELTTREDCTFIVDDIDAAARRIIHANSGSIETATFPERIAFASSFQRGPCYRARIRSWRSNGFSSHLVITFAWSHRNIR